MIEHELKFALTASMAAEFEQRATIGLARPAAHLHARYFDTSAGDLMNASVSLRVRKSPDGFIQAVKGPGSTPFERYEWEKAVSGDSPDYHALPPETHPAGLLTRECFGLLVPVFETDFQRQVRLVLPQPGVRVEIACDRGVIRAGKRTEQIGEVELERKEGSAAAFYHYAMQWARLHHAQLLLPSKNLRGLRLAGWQTEKPAAVKAIPKSPPGNLAVADAAKQVLVGHLNHFLDNVGAVMAGSHPEGPHQLRVALRRFRSAIRFFELRRQHSQANGTPEEDEVTAVWRDIDRGARALASAASFVRDADVLEAGLLASLDKTFPRDAALHVLGRSLATERERQRSGLRQTLESTDTTVFVLLAYSAAESLPSDRWQERDYAGFAATRLTGLVARLRRRVRRARQEQDWHDVRIAIKNLRYALEGCRALPVTTGSIDEVITTLAQWQDALGLGQDLAVARSIASQALAHTAAPTEMTVRAAALIDGYRAFATRIESPRKLRRPILAHLKHLLAHHKGPDPAAGPSQGGIAPSRGEAAKRQGSLSESAAGPPQGGIAPSRREAAKRQGSRAESAAAPPQGGIAGPPDSDATSGYHSTCSPEAPAITRDEGRNNEFHKESSE